MLMQFLCFEHEHPEGRKCNSGWFVRNKCNGWRLKPEIRINGEIVRGIYYSNLYQLHIFQLILLVNPSSLKSIEWYLEIIKFTIWERSQKNVHMSVRIITLWISVGFKYRYTIVFQSSMILLVNTSTKKWIAFNSIFPNIIFHFIHSWI